MAPEGLRDDYGGVGPRAEWEIHAGPARTVARHADEVSQEHDPTAIEALLVDFIIEAHAKAPRQITLDLDATDDPV